MRLFAFLFPLSALFLSACLEDRSFPEPLAPDKGTIRELKTGSLIINEIYAEGTTGTAEPYDWIELYNPSDSAVVLEAGRFFASDAPTKIGDYSPARNFLIPGKGFLWIAFQNGAGTHQPDSLGIRQPVFLLPVSLPVSGSGPQLAIQ